MTPREKMVTSTPSDVESEWRFGPVSGPLSGGLTAVLAAVAEPVVAYPHWAPVAVTAVGAGAVAAIGALRRRPLGLLAYRSACWVGAGAWTTWIASQGWSWAAGVVLGGGALAAGIAAELVREVDLRAEVKRSTTPADEDQPGRRLYPRELTVKAAIDALLNLPLPGVQIISIEDWESGSGYTVRLEFPAETGYGDEELRSITLRLARRLRLPAGCIPEVDEGDLQGEVILRIPTLDDLSETAEYPADYSPLSIYDEHPLGIFGDQSLAADEMRESSKLIGGRKGGGKTNVLDVYAANLQRTEDALIWDIDLNGGGMSAFWMLPFAQGEVEKPPIDWAAADADEALLMSCVALAVAKARKAQYAGRRARANTRLLPIDRKLPAIILRIDEGAEVLGDSCPYPLLRENIKELHRIGREIGENFIISTLRPTGEMIPVEIRKNSSTRVGTRVEEDSELHYLFPQAGVKLKSRMLKTRGEAFLSRGDAGASDGPVRRMKWFHLLPDRIREVVLATNHLRPELDDFSRMVADAPFELMGQKLAKVYSTRWERLAPWLARLAEEGPAELAEAEKATPAPAIVPPATTADALARYAEAKRAAEVARDAAATQEGFRRILAADEETIAGTFESLTAELRKPDPTRTVFLPPPPAVTLEERARTVAEIVQAAGVSGAMRRDVIASLKDRGIEVTDQTVSEWLAAAREAGLVQPGPKKGQWLPGGEGR
jgi:hypothetical protein